MENKLYDVIITPDAENDLWNIKDYITYKLLEPETANEYVQELKSGILSLDNMPEKFSLVEFEPWRSRGCGTSMLRILSFTIMSGMICLLYI